MRALVVSVVAACNFQAGSTVASSDGATHFDSVRVVDVKQYDDGHSVMADAMRDAPTDVCTQNLSACTLAGGSCSNGTCVITSVTNTDITCPSGMPCEIDCATANVCSGKHLDCSQATSCAIECSATNTCNGSTFDCDNAGCTVYCRVANICDGFSLSDHSSTCTIECCSTGNICNGDSASPTSCTFGNSCP